MSGKGARWAVAVFGDSVESGRPEPGAGTRAVALLGDSTLDMRTLTTDDKVSVTAVAGFGDVRVTVPPGTRVEMSGFALFGDKRNEVTRRSDEGPLLTVRAWALFGDVKVSEPMAKTVTGR